MMGRSAGRGERCQRLRRKARRGRRAWNASVLTTFSANSLKLIDFLALSNEVRLPRNRAYRIRANRHARFYWRTFSRITLTQHTMDVFFGWVGYHGAHQDLFRHMRGAANPAPEC